ncbi:hypothetical protein EV356DRAFT_475327 [Viridothelium virens]|uniref:ATP synthase F(0) complex subunit e, mitochondrial n=1 Tax=Viridothelium virens TaxID=1048519 RepID=A0A6A6GV66_VIRVR|nr:hypothetical protein EV356DRAFT_475327 [Viridothelium virens]
MSTSSGVNVLRYSALVFGVFYGFTHQRSITSREKQDAVNREWQRKTDLIAQARAEYTKQHTPPESKTASGGLITNPEDPKFDLEAYLNMVDAESKGK